MKASYKVLLVEDDKLISKSLAMSLPYKGFEVTACGTVGEGLEAFRHKRFDVVLLDVNLPDGNGFELCGELRELNDSIPILMLTAKTDEESAVNGLESGADDYVRKPYGVQELVARMQRLLERRKKEPAAFCFGPLKIDPQKRIAWANEVALSLGKREFDILTLLVKKSGNAVTRNEILNSLGEEAEIYDRTIDSHLSHLRKKLKDAGAHDVQIVPIYGVGYRMEAAGEKK
jgi:DNA-binding response OmpR family regulator